MIPKKVNNRRLLVLCMPHIIALIRLSFCSSFDNPTKNCRGVLKAEEKLATTETLLVDANNVRGVGRFLWNPCELQQRIVACSMRFGISRTIIVWDHANSKSAIPFFMQNENNHLLQDPYNNNNNCIVLFSGLFHRADDVIVEEARHLSALYCTPYNVDDGTKSGWESLGFVTNDGGLIGRLLQRHVIPGKNHEKQESKWKASDTINKVVRPVIPGKNHEKQESKWKASDTINKVVRPVIPGKNHEKQEAKWKASDTIDKVVRPVTVDSTSFVEILSRFEKEELEIISGDSLQNIDITMNVTLESLRHFVTTKQRQGWNPRREKTWERCVLAESLRRSLCQQQQQSIICDESFENSHASTLDRSPFITQYLMDLKKRGYLGAEEIIQQKLSSAGDEINGPTRLDRRQRRLLGRYNAFRKKRNALL